MAVVFMQKFKPAGGLQAVVTGAQTDPAGQKIILTLLIAEGKLLSIIIQPAGPEQELGLKVQLPFLNRSKA